jgi:hypothetical protein
VNKKHWRRLIVFGNDFHLSPPPPPPRHPHLRPSLPVTFPQKWKSILVGNRDQISDIIIQRSLRNHHSNWKQVSALSSSRSSFSLFSFHCLLSVDLSCDRFCHSPSPRQMKWNSILLQPLFRNMKHRPRLISSILSSAASLSLLSFLTLSQLLSDSSTPSSTPPDTSPPTPSPFSSLPFLWHLFSLLITSLSPLQLIITATPFTHFTNSLLIILQPSSC